MFQTNNNLINSMMHGEDAEMVAELVNDSMCRETLIEFIQYIESHNYLGIYSWCEGVYRQAQSKYLSLNISPNKTKKERVFLPSL